MIFGKKDKTRKKLSTIKNIRIIAKQVDMLAYMNKIAVEIIKIDEIENISNILQIKSKNKYKKNDDRIAATIEYAAKCGLRMIDLDIENGGAVFVETIFDKENFEEFLNKMRLLFAEIDLNIIVYKSEKVHYTTNLTDKFGKVRFGRYNNLKRSICVSSADTNRKRSGYGKRSKYLKFYRNC